MTDRHSLRTNATLIHRVRNQYDEASWEEFVRFYRPYIFAVIIKLQVNTDERDDLGQKILLGLWEKLPSFNYVPEKSRFRTWLSAVIRNQVYTYYSKTNSELKKRYGLEAEEGGDNKPEIYDIMDKEWKIYISNLAWDNVKEQFSEKSRSCFLLLSEAKSPQSVADELGLDVATVYVHKKRILDKLYREIARLDNELG